MFAVVQLPDFFLQAVLRLEPELHSQPVGLVDKGDSKKTLIIQSTAAAQKSGVTEGLTPTQAVARCETIVLKTRSPGLEESATTVFFQTLYGFSPHLEVTGPGIATLDLQGLKLGAENAIQAWAEQIVAELAQFHLRARVGFGSTPGMALLVSRVADPCLFVQESLEFVKSLPFESLSPPPEMAAIVRLWGVKTIGKFLELGRERLAERLGPGVMELFDRLEVVRPLELFTPTHEFLERMEFQHLVETVEPLLFVLQRFVEQLSKRLEMNYRVIGELELELILESGARLRHHFKIPSPTNHLPVLFRMMQTHLETLRTQSPIVEMVLTAKPARAQQDQFGLFETTLRDPNQFAETLSRLVALCGEGKSGMPELTATHRPDGFTMKHSGFAPVASQLNPSAVKCAPRRQGLQLRRFRPALRAHIEFRDALPVLIRSRACSGTIENSCGPFMSSGDWWEKARHWEREEWDVQTGDGTLYRIFRSRDQFFIEGMYD